MPTCLLYILEFSTGKHFNIVSEIHNNMLVLECFVVKISEDGTPVSKRL